MRAGRLAMAAALGSGFALLCTLLPGNRIVTALIATGMSILICEIAFSPQKALQRLRFVLFFHIFSAVFAGTVGYFDTILPQFLPGIASQTPSRGRLFFVGGLCVCCGILFLAIRIFRLRDCGKKIRVVVRFGQCEITLDCFADSGNLLTEPFSGLPVILCSADAFADYKEQIRRRFRLIPSSGVGGHELLEGFLPDCIIVRRQSHTEKKRAVIAFCGTAFPSECNGIIPVSLL